MSDLILPTEEQVERARMPLLAALSILVQAHTQDDDMAGYTVEQTVLRMGFRHSRAAYNEAWGVVRSYLRSDEPIALTEDHIPSLERAIRAEGYDIKVDTETGEVKLYRVSDGK